MADCNPNRFFGVLPQELTDTIIDFLHDDRNTLKSCSLVCHSWIPATRFHLFRRITLDLTPNDNSKPAPNWTACTKPRISPMIQTFIQICDYSPVISSSIEKLDVHAKVSGHKWKWGAKAGYFQPHEVNAQTLLFILNKLQSLKSLNFTGIYIGKSEPISPHSPSFRAFTLDRLVLHHFWLMDSEDISEPIAQDLTCLFDLFYEIGELGISTSEIFIFDAGWLDVVEFDPDRLRNLELHSSRHLKVTKFSDHAHRFCVPSAVLVSIISPNHLTTLEWNVFIPKYVIKGYIHEHAKSLSALNVSLGEMSRSEEYASFSFDVIGLSKCHALTSVKLWSTWPGTIFLESIGAFTGNLFLRCLSSLPKHVTEITLYFNLNNDSEWTLGWVYNNSHEVTAKFIRNNWPWKEIENQLLAFTHLKLVAFIQHEARLYPRFDVPLRHVDSSNPLFKAIEDGLPHFRGTPVLQFAYGYRDLDCV
ncbi:hypothetical protein ABKN59_008145 [Abortiporus biennis]